MLRSIWGSESIEILWFGHVERLNCLLLVLTEDVSGWRGQGRSRLGWMDGVKVALGGRGMMVEAARQCAKYRKEWRALLYMKMISLTRPFMLGATFYVLGAT